MSWKNINEKIDDFHEEDEEKNKNKKHNSQQKINKNEEKKEEENKARIKNSNGWRRFNDDKISLRKNHSESSNQNNMNIFSLSGYGNTAVENEGKKTQKNPFMGQNTEDVQHNFNYITDKPLHDSDKRQIWGQGNYEKNMERWSNGTQRKDKIAYDFYKHTEKGLYNEFSSHPDSLHRSLKPVLILARCFALLPVEGISAPNSSSLEFNWYSFPSIYLGIVIGYSILIALLSIWKTVQYGISYYSTVDFVFVTSSMVIYLLFLQLAIRWPKMMNQWEKAERGMRHYGYPKRMALKFKCILFLLMSLAIIEHIASIITAVFEALPCSSGGWDIIRAYFVIKFRQVFSFVQFNILFAFPILVMNLILTCAWNFMDVFIILMAFAMAERYKQVNDRLNSVKSKVLPTSFWRQSRETYNTLSCLTKLLDSLLSPIVLLSFANNLYFICLQLLNSLRPMQSTWQATYFVYSFTYLLVRTIAVSLFAASVHDQSKEPKSVLFSVPTESYCVEVSRFLMQVTNDDLALTGCKFFAVTRTFMLTIAGTIVTYEIVLVQFNAVSSEDAAAAKNISIICP